MIPLFLLLLISGGLCLSGEVTVKPNRFLGTNRQTIIQKFGFESGGSVQLEISSAGVSGYLLVSSESYYQYLFRHEMWDKEICGSSASNPLKISLKQSHANLTISARQYTYFISVICQIQNDNWSIKVKYNLINPGDSKLSLDEQFLPTIYIAFSCIWIALCFYYLFSLIFCKSKISPIHCLFASIAFLRTVLVVGTLVFWTFYKQKGIRMEIMLYFFDFFYSISELFLFSVLIVISRGWRITRPGISILELRTLGLICLILIIALLFFSFYNTNYYVLCLLAMYFFALPKVFSYITNNLFWIEDHLQELSDHRLSAFTLFDLDEIVKSLKVKQKFFSRFRGVLLLYLGLVISINGGVKLLISSSWWLSSIVIALNESLSWLTIFALSVLTRPNGKGLFLHNAAFLVQLSIVQYWLQHAEDESSAVRLNKKWDMSKTVLVKTPQSLNIAYEETYNDEVDK